MVMFRVMNEDTGSFPTIIFMLVERLIFVNICTVISLLITIFFPSIIILRSSYRHCKAVNTKFFNVVAAV